MTSLIKSEEERDVNNKRWRYENLQHNQWRRMKLHTGLQSQQQNHRLKAAWLQDRWLEVSEQERRAQLHNQKLLQDFQRAQDTLDDMVARTEAMNTIRVQYERYLEENFPRWQQKLKDMRVSEKSKISKEDILKNAGNRATLPPLISIRVQKHLKNCVHQMEEDQGINAEYRSDTTAHPLSSIFPDHTQLPTSLLYTHHVDKDTRQNSARCNQNDQAYLRPTWLTGSQPLISGFPQNNIPKDYKNFHNIQALSHNLPPCYSLPCDSHHQSHSPVQHKSSTINHMYQNPWPGIGQGIGVIPTGHCASWPQLPVLNPMAWGMMDVPDPHVERNQCSETDQENTTQEMLRPSKESNLRLKHKSKGREREYLDCRPDHEESSALSSEVSGMKKKIKKRRHRTVSQSKANGRKYQSSSTLSQDSCGQADPQKSKKHQKPSTTAEQENSKKTTDNETYAVKQDEEDDEQEESRSQKTTPSHAGSDKTDGLEVNLKNSGEKEDTDKNNHELIADEKISDRKGVDESDEEMVADRDDKEDAGLDDREGNREETEHSDGEVMEKKDAEEDIPDSDSEEGEDKPEREIEKNCSHDELVKEARKAQGGTLKSARKNETESDEEERNIQITNNSLKELYGNDETKEEEIVYNQEIYDDDDDDDEIVVEQSFPWTKDSLYDQTKCNDDNNEDIEDLLNPHVSSQTHQEDDVEDTDQPNDLHSDSDVEDLPKKSAPAATNKPAESDDEFDHFYD